ncbi:GntR family transcriptional regulator [uncultured Roseibium sp.]|uniref:GntR family transcriptional regulator n=1 Tax=uncultured Roseibium sp. TaxID=1936171 RepID=UPI00344C1780
MITTEHEIYLSIRKQIFSGQIGVDTFVNIKELSNQLRVSALPIREALIRLASEDLIHYSRTKGYFISKIDYNSLINAYNNMYILAKSATIWRLNNPADRPPLRSQHLDEVHICPKNLQPDSIDLVLEGVAATLMNDHSSRLFLHELRRTRPYRYCIAPYREDKAEVISNLKSLRSSILSQDYKTTLTNIRDLRNNAIRYSPINYDIYSTIVK